MDVGGTASKKPDPRSKELDTAAALCKVAETPDWTDLSDHTFVLFGAGEGELQTAPSLKFGPTQNWDLGMGHKDMDRRC